MSEKIIIPLSILVAAIVIGGAIFFSSSSGETENQISENESPEINVVNPEEDHIQGNPNADLFIIEYADLECPFCKTYHENILKPLVNEYASEGRVAFVYRHFPLDAPYTRVVHATATEEAVASECVARIGGNQAFFDFIDQIFATTNSDGRFNLDTLPDIAESVGVNRQDFTSCYENDETKELVTADFEDGVTGGVEGTPSIFVQDSIGNTLPGVSDYNVLKEAIEIFLEENPESGETTGLDEGNQTGLPTTE